jgi:phospholipase/carboxylesterase
MGPLSTPPEAALAAKAVLILSGATDPIVPADNAARLAQQLKAAGACTTHEVLPAGHALSQADVARAREWLASR